MLQTLLGEVLLRAWPTYYASRWINTLFALWCALLWLDSGFINTLRPRQDGRHFPDDIFFYPQCYKQMNPTTQGHLGIWLTQTVLHSPFQLCDNVWSYSSEWHHICSVSSHEIVMKTQQFAIPTIAEVILSQKFLTGQETILPVWL